jgi:hypothetical protein
MRIGTEFRHGVLRFAQPRLDRTHGFSFDGFASATMTLGSGGDNELILKQTRGHFDESGADPTLLGVTSRGNWDGTDPT